MTHDELLATIDESSRVCELDSPAWHALRAIMKLHFNDNEQCGVCRHEWDYPCPTIQAIEKELR